MNDVETLIEQLDGCDNDVQRRDLLLRARQESADPAWDDTIVDRLKAQSDRYQESNRDQAWQYAALILDYAKETGDPLHRGMGLRARANVESIIDGEHGKSLQTMREARSIYTKHGEQIIAALIGSAMITPLGMLGRIAEAERLLEEIRPIFQAANHPLLAGQAEANFGIVALRLGNFSDAQMALDRAAAHYATANVDYPGWIGLIEIHRATAWRGRGYLEQSLAAVKRAIGLFQPADFATDEARARNEEAVTRFLQGKFQLAMQQYDTARRLYIENGLRHATVGVDLDIAECLLHLRQFDAALQTVTTALTNVVDGSLEVIQLRLLAARITLAQGDAAESLRQLSALDATLQQRGDSDYYRALTALTRARAFSALGRMADCRAAAVTVNTLASHLPHVAAYAQLLLAQTALRLGELDSAEIALQAIDQTLEHDSDIQYRKHYLLGQLAESHNDLSGAIAQHETAIDHLETLRGGMMVDHTVHFFEDKQVIYEDAVRLYLQSGQPMRGLAYAERAKSRALLALLGNNIRLTLGESLSAESQTLLTELQRLETQRNVWIRQQPTDSSARATARMRQNDLYQIERQMQQLRQQLLLHTPPVGQHQPAPITTIAAALEPDALLLEYFITRNSVTLFVVSQTERRAVNLGNIMPTVTDTMRYFELNRDGLRQLPPVMRLHLEVQAQQLLGQLYQLLLQPIADLLARYRRLIFVPYRSLHHLPFQALFDGQRYLIETHIITRLPAASLLPLLKNIEPTGTETVLFGHTNGGELGHVSAEIATIATTTPATIFENHAATCANFTQHTATARIIHTAAHGRFHSDNPLFSGICLEDGDLTVLQILELELHAALVVLSACETGRNVVSDSDELLGLTRAFFHAGVPTLLATQWLVEDNIAANLMQQFYAALLQGVSAAEALRAAQLTIINAARRGENSYGHPYFWSPFFITGTDATIF